MLAGGMLLGSMLMPFSLGLAVAGLFADISGLGNEFGYYCCHYLPVDFVVRRFILGRLNKSNQAGMESRPNNSVRDRYVEENPVQDIKAETIELSQFRILSHHLAVRLRCLAQDGITRLTALLKDTVICKRKRLSLW